MPELSSEIKSKIAALRAKSGGWESIEVFELLKIEWISGARYYAVTAIDELVPDLPFEVEARLISDSYPDYFLGIDSTSSLGDEEVDLKFSDTDGAIADLVFESGEGIKVELFYYFPAVDLLLSHWWGHLRTDEDSDMEFWQGKAANGFRSPNLPMPRRLRFKECQAIFGAHLNTLEEIAHNDCPYNAHLPGGTVGNGLYATCDRTSPNSCIARGVNPLYHLSHHSAVVTVQNSQTSGPQLLSVARGNESNMKESVRVVMGVRRVRDMPVLAFRRDYNNNNPDKGWFDALYEACEGPIQGFQAARVNGVNVQAQHYGYHLGETGQPSWAALSSHGYSGTARFRYNYGWVNPEQVGPENMKGEALVYGLRNVREYADENNFAETTSRNRAWHIARMFCDKRWGYGLDYQRLDINSFIEAANWSSKTVTFTTPEGISYAHERGRSDVELVGRTAQQQIEDMCLAGRFSRPFLFQGKTHIQPLRSLSDAELAAAPVFSDYGDDRNIIVDENGKSSLTRSQTSDLDLPNRIEATFDNEADDWKEATAPVAESVEQQLRAGRVLGDTSRRQVTKKYSFLGVTQEGAAVKLSHGILWFGEFDEGGLKNNLRVKFKIWVMDALDLHENKVIKVLSKQIERYGFEYFRIIGKKRAGNLHFEITAQAFNNEALKAFETENEVQPPVITNPVPGEIPLPTGGGGGGGGGNENPLPTCQLKLGEISYQDGLLNVPILPC